MGFPITQLGVETFWGTKIKCLFCKCLHFLPSPLGENEIVPTPDVSLKSRHHIPKEHFRAICITLHMYQQASAGEHLKEPRSNRLPDDMRKLCHGTQSAKVELRLTPDNAEFTGQLCFLSTTQAQA